MVSPGCSFCWDDLADGGAGGGLVDDLLAGGAGGDERGDGEVVDGAELAAGRTVRAAGRGGADRPADVARRPGAMAGNALPAAPAAQFAQYPATPAPADPDRRQLRAEDPAPRRPLWRHVQPVRSARNRLR